LASVDSYNDEGIWNWNQHGSDWIYQGGPDSSATKNMPYYNQWEDFDDSPVSWHITEVRAREREGRRIVLL